MMFKAVNGSELADFDPETINLYRRREISDRDAFTLMTLQRRARNHLPVVVSKENKLVQESEKRDNRILLNLALGSIIFGMSPNIPLRISNPVFITCSCCMP